MHYSQWRSQDLEVGRRHMGLRDRSQQAESMDRAARGESTGEARSTLEISVYLAKPHEPLVKHEKT